MFKTHNSSINCDFKKSFFAAVATNQLGYSPPVVCEEKFPWLLSQSRNTSSAVNMEGDGVV